MPAGAAALPAPLEFPPPAGALGHVAREHGLDPDRLALYSYAHVTWLAKQQRGFERKDLPEARTKLRIMLGAIRRAQRYVHLETYIWRADEIGTEFAQV